MILQEQRDCVRFLCAISFKWTTVWSCLRIAFVLFSDILFSTVGFISISIHLQISLFGNGCFWSFAYHFIEVTVYSEVGPNVWDVFGHNCAAAWTYIQCIYIISRQFLCIFNFMCSAMKWMHWNHHSHLEYCQKTHLDALQHQCENCDHYHHYLINRKKLFLPWNYILWSLVLHFSSSNEGLVSVPYKHTCGSKCLWVINISSLYGLFSPMKYVAFMIN